MTNIVICQINSKYIHSSLAAWYILAGVREYAVSDINASVVEGTVNEKCTAVSDRIIAKAPEIVGFSSYIWNIDTVKAVANEVRLALPGVKIIFGGPEVSFSYSALLCEGTCDYVVCGEGEKSFARLCDAIISGDDPAKISGVALLHDGKVISNPPEELGEPPSPYLPEYFDTLNGRIAYLETSRGCPFSCAFCLSGHESKVVFFDEERAKSDLVRLANSGTSTIKLVDRTFNADRKRACHIWDFISENYGDLIPAGVRIHFEISSALLDDKAYASISRLPRGAAQFEVGIQSFNTKTLAAIGRDTDIDRTARNTKRLIELGNVHVHTDLIAGLPFEDYKSFGESFDKAFALGAHMLQLGFLKVLSGSPMGDVTYPYKCEYSKSAPYEVIKTEWISENELDRIRKIEDLHERIYNSGRFRRTFDFALDATKMTPFDLYEKLSDTIVYAPGCSLDEFTLALLTALGALGVSDTRALYDIAVIDRITTNNEGRVPEFLKGDKSMTAKLKHHLEETEPTLFNKGVKSAIFYLESQSRGVYVRYDTPPDPITGEYEGIFVDM